MIGTVFGLEWLLASRRRWHQRLRFGYLLILLAEVALFLYAVAKAILITPNHAVAFLIDDAQTLFYALLWQQPIAIAMLAPAMSAGSISDEKQRGTLDFLLAAPLSAADIVLGKWLGQASQVFTLLCPVYVIFAALAGLLGSSLLPLAALLGSHLLLIGALVALGLAASVLARTTMWAVVCVYGVLVIALALAYGLGISIFTFDFTPGGELHLRQRLLPVAGILAMVLAASLLLAILRLRPSHEGQRSRVRAVNAHDRRTMGDAPMRWKERYAAGWFAVPVWNRLPMWSRLGLVMLATAGVTLTPPVTEERNMVVALAFFALTSLWVGIRSAGAITAEREQQTWDSLIVTCLDARQIVRGKLWGNLDAARPYLFAYLPVALVGAAQADWLVMVVVLYLWCAAWAYLYFFAACGLHSSARSTSTWQSLILTLLQAGGRTALTSAVVALPGMFCVLSLAIGWAGRINLAFVVLTFLLFLWTPVLAVLLSQTEELLEQTEKEWRLLKETAGRSSEAPLAHAVLQEAIAILRNPRQGRRGLRAE